MSNYYFHIQTKFDWKRTRLIPYTGQLSYNPSDLVCQSHPHLPNTTMSVSPVTTHTFPPPSVHPFTTCLCVCVCVCVWHTSLFLCVSVYTIHNVQHPRCFKQHVCEYISYGQYVNVDQQVFNLCLLLSPLSSLECLTLLA